MAGSSTTYTINFEANLSNLQKLQSELTKIKNNANIKLDVGGKKSLELLEGQLNSVIKAIQAKMQDGKMASGDILGLKSQFADLLKLTDNFKASLLDLSVSPDAIEQIKKLSEQLTIAQEQLKVLRAHRKDAAAGFKVTDGKVERPLLQTKNQAFADVKGSMSLTAPNSDKVITSYQQLENVITKLRAELGEDISKWTGEAANLGQIWNEINAELDKRVAEAQQKLDDATAAVQQKREEITNIKADLKAAQDAAIDTSDLTDEMRDQLRAVQDVSTAMDVDYKTTLQEVRTEQKKATTATNQGTDSTKKATTTFGRAIQNVVSYGTAIQLVRRIYQNFIRTITDLDKALTNMTVVTTLTRDQAWELTGTLQSLAKQTGMTSTEIANMTTMYLQQGKTLEDALTLTEAAAKAARIAGISGEESINLLTNAMNGFQLAASEAMEVSDKFAALAASAATNYEELATALSKVAAQANLAGLSMDFTLGLLTKGIETTREAPETIGTALKTVLSRMRELTDYGKTLEDGLDVNRVEKALTNVGIALRDSNGQFRDMESVLIEVGMKWDQLNTNQQANIAVALAGTRCRREMACAWAA